MQNGCILDKEVVFGQKWYYSCKSGCNGAKLVVLGQRCCIRAQVVVFEQKFIYLGKVVVFGQKSFYSDKVCIRTKWLYLGKGCLKSG